MWCCHWASKDPSHTFPIEQHHIPEKTWVLNTTTTRTLNLPFILWFSGVGHSFGQQCARVHKFSGVGHSFGQQCARVHEFPGVGHSFGQQCARMHEFSGVGHSFGQQCARVHKFSKKSRSSLEISGTEDSQTLGTTLQNLITWVTWCLGFVHPWICGYQ